MTPDSNNGHDTPLLRPRYFPRQAVTAADLTADQDYFRERLRRHNRLLHGSGVVCGLMVSLKPRDPAANTPEYNLVVMPGVAIGPMGDEIEVDAPAGGLILGTDDFCFMTGGEADARTLAVWPPPSQNPCPGGTLTNEIYYLGVCYHQAEKNPRPVLRGNCYETAVCENTRWQDSYQFVLLDTIDPAADSVLINRYAEDLAWKGEYYNFTPAAGALPQFPVTPPDRVRYDAAIDFTWGAGSPITGIAGDHFMARWTRRLYFPAGRYRFTADTDDGVRLKIDDKPVITRWETGDKVASANVTLSAGVHTVVMEYFEMGGTAKARLSWEVLDVGWYAEYFRYTPANPFTPPTFPGSATTPTLVRIDPSVGFQWGSAAPDASVGADDFMVRWMRDIEICEAGMYEFVCRTDDGMRVYIDGVQILNSWVLQGATIYRPRVGLSEGRHQVRVEFFEHGGVATAQMYWHQVGPYNPVCVEPQPGGCVILAAVSVQNGKIQGVDNFVFDPVRGYQRKVLVDTESLAGRIACLNKPEFRPALAQIVPGSGVRGTTVRAVIFGSRLGGATALAFASTGLTGRILPDGTESWLPVEITIAENAALGESTFSLLTPEGTLDSANFSVRFRVEGAIVQPTTAPPFTGTFTFVFTTPPIIFSSIPPDIVVTQPPLITGIDIVTGDIFVNPGDIFINPGDVFVNPGDTVFTPGAGSVVNPGTINVVNTGANVFNPVAGGVNVAPIVGGVVMNNPVGEVGFEQPGGAGFVGGVINRIMAVSGSAEAQPGAASGEQPEMAVRSVKGVGAVTAGKLESAGITTAQQLANTAPKALADMLGVSEVRAMSLIDNARQLIGFAG